MYVTPRPDPVEDPLYGIRLGLTGALAFAAIPILDPVMPSIIAALPVGLIAAQRRVFSLAAAIGGPVAMSVVAIVMTWFVEWLAPMPLVYVGAMWLVYFAGFLMILRTGAPAGMLIIVLGVLISVMGMNGHAAVETMRDGILEASLVALVIAPVVYALLPPRTRLRHVPDPTPERGNVVTGAAIRAGVLLALSFWLYAVMDPSDITMAIIAAMVLVFPTRRAVFDEANQRVRATLYGGAAALGVIAFFALSPHLPILLGLVFLCGLYLGQKMLHGPRQGMVYQYAFSVALALIAGAVSTQDPASAALARIALTLTGAFIAAFAVALLDAATDWRDARDDPAPAAG